MKKVVFIGENPLPENEQWFGGATTSAFMRDAMQHSKKIEIEYLDLNEFVVQGNLNDHAYKRLLNRSDIDLLHLDNTLLLQLIFRHGFNPPEVIGPLAYAPDTIKSYDNGEWKSIYTADWYYSNQVMRLNRSEELKLFKLDVSTELLNYKNRVSFISHGIMGSLFEQTPPWENPDQRKYVLWAGDSFREAKNFALWQQVKEKLKGKLPEQYELKDLVNYKVDEYWYETLPRTALLVNTSYFETFCNAMFEANAMGIPSIHRYQLHNDVFRDKLTQVEYNAEAYCACILEILQDRERWLTLCHDARNYASKHASPQRMTHSYEEVYDKALFQKHGGK